MAMRSYDLSPLYRATVGFDRMMNLLDTTARVEESAPSYPPYNIEKSGEDTYRISMAVAGFAEEELDITSTQNSLVVSGKKEKAVEKDGKFLHRGIANRSFQRSFELADHIKVAGAVLENGLLHVDLVREVPETLKPRSIKIDAIQRETPQVIEDKAA
jgi:molecular chaperone IbpA